MNIVAENQPNCLVTLQVELPADRVSKEWKEVASQFQRQVRIPGYRPGKAPQSIVDSRFAKDIREELTNRLLRSSLDEAIKEKKLRVITVSQVENVEIADDKTMRYRATVVTAPEFELPDYSAIDAEIPAPKVTDEDINRWLDELREPHSNYAPVEDRPVQMGDFAVISYTGTIDGKPIAEVVPDTPQQLQGRRNAWMLMAEKSLVPGFAEALVGTKNGEEKTISIDIPEDFPIESLRGKKIDYATTLHAINVKNVPELTDELAGKIDPGSTLEQLKEKMRTRLEEFGKNQYENAKRQAAVRFLLAKVECEVPESLVEREMESILKDIVRENQGRGISDEEIRKHEDELLGAAEQGAQERVRGNFLLLRVAEKENLQVAEQDIAQRVYQMAAQYEIPVNKLVKDLQKKNGFGPLREQILMGKALDLLSANVTVREPAAAEAPAA
jgi:trigger factor